MTNNTPDYNDNLYFEKKKMDCKNCPYTDEYCASGDCERNADVSKTLTEQWKKGELPNGSYYVKYADGEIETAEYKQLFNEKTQSFYFEFDFQDEICEVLAPVPTYKELNEILESEEKSHLQADSYYNKILDLKELLKECRDIMNKAGFIFTKIADVEKAKDLIKKIGEVLK